MAGPRHNKNSLIKNGLFSRPKFLAKLAISNPLVIDANLPDISKIIHRVKVIPQMLHVEDTQSTIVTVFFGRKPEKQVPKIMVDKSENICWF